MSIIYQSERSKVIICRKLMCKYECFRQKVNHHLISKSCIDSDGSQSNSFSLVYFVMIFWLDCRLLFDAFLGHCFRLSKWVRLESIFTAVKPGKSDIESQRRKKSHRQSSDYRISADINSRTKQCKVNLDESLSCWSKKTACTYSEFLMHFLCINPVFSNLLF